LRIFGSLLHLRGLVISLTNRHAILAERHSFPNRSVDKSFPLTLGVDENAVFVAERDYLIFSTNVKLVHW